MKSMSQYTLTLCLVAAAGAISTPAQAQTCISIMPPSTANADGTHTDTSDLPPGSAPNWATNGASLTIYQSAINKVIEDAPTLVGPTFSNCIEKQSFASDSINLEVCHLGYDVGIQAGSFALNIGTPTTMAMTIGDNGNISLDFDIDFKGSVTPYAQVSACGFGPEIAPPITANGVYGTINANISVVKNQIVVNSLDTAVKFHQFNVDIGFADDILSVIGLDDTFQGWIQDLVQLTANKMVSAMAPTMITKMLAGKLDIKQTVVVPEGTQTASFLANVQADSFHTVGNAGNGSMTFSIDSSIEPVTPGACPSGANCVEPTWAPTVGQPDAVDSTTNADAAIAIGASAFNQALFGAWRAGVLAYHTTLDAATVMGALFPGLPIDGSATIDLETTAAPSVSFDSDADPTVNIPSVALHIQITPQTQGNMPLDLYLTTGFSATAIVDITPPDINGVPNAQGNQVQFHAENFSIATTTIKYGESSGHLTDDERDALLNQVVIPQLQQKIGTMPVTSSIATVDATAMICASNMAQTACQANAACVWSSSSACVSGNVPGLFRRAALHVLRKTRATDALAVYIRFDISPAGDTTPPTVEVSTVDGNTLDPDTHIVFAGTHSPVVSYGGIDDNAEFNDYITYQTSLGGLQWTPQNLIHSIKLAELPEGFVDFYVKGTDFAGNVSNPTGKSGAGWAHMLVDTLPPTTAITVPPPNYTNQKSTQLTFSGADAGSGVKDFVVQVDAGAVSPATTQTTYTVNGLTEGSHQVTVKAQDMLGHQDPIGMTASFVADFTPPTTLITAARTGYVRPSAARFALSGNDNLSPLQLMHYSNKLTGAVCSHDFTGFSAVPVADLTGCNMTDGPYTLEARAQDAAGNVDGVGATTTFTVDGTPPVVQLLEQPAARATDKTLSFMVAGTDNMTPAAQIVYSYRMSANDTYSVPTSNPSILVDGVPSGNYTFEVVALDLAENQSTSVTYAFALDNQAPTTDLTQAATWTNARDVVLAVTGSDDLSTAAALQFAVTVDSDAAKVLPQPVTLSGLDEGRHLVNVAAVDEFGNVDPVGAQTQFTVDRTPPKTKVISGIKDINLGTFKPQVTGTDNYTPVDELRYTYRVTHEAAAQTDWSEPVLAKDLSIPLREKGEVTIEIAAVDNAGNVDPVPATINSEVVPAGGCDCSATSGSPQELLPFAAFALLFALRKLRRRSAK